MVIYLILSLRVARLRVRVFSLFSCAPCVWYTWQYCILIIICIYMHTHDGIKRSLGQHCMRVCKIELDVIRKQENVVMNTRFPNPLIAHSHLRRKNPNIIHTSRNIRKRNISYYVNRIHFEVINWYVSWIRCFCELGTKSLHCSKYTYLIYMELFSKLKLYSILGTLKTNINKYYELGTYC